LADFFQPVPLDQMLPDQGYSSVQLGSLIDIFTLQFAELGGDHKPHLALFGVDDDRKAIGNEGCSGGADVVRRQLYSLYSGDYNIKIADLGNMAAGETMKDTYVAVTRVCEELMKADIIPVLI